MSAAPSLPPDLQPPDRNRLHIEPPRRRRWTRILAWLGAAIVALLVILVVGVAVLLHSSRFHDYVLRTAQQKTTNSLNAPVTVQNYALNFNGISPTLDIYGLVVHGAAPYPDPPVLQVEHIRGTIRVVSVLRRTWYLEDIEVHHPVAQLFQDRHGVTNIPQPKPSDSGSSTNLFDLAVRHAVVDQGEIYVNSRKMPLAADLHDLTFHAGYDTTKTEYSGTLSYRDGHLKYGAYDPIPHDLDAAFSYTPTAFTLQNATLHSGHSRFLLNATVNDFNAPRVNATYDATLDVSELRHTLKDPSLPTGILNTTGSLEYRSRPGAQALDLVNLHGSIFSSMLQVQTPSYRGAIRELRANYEVQNGDAFVHDLHALLLGGVATGDLEMRHLTGDTRSRLQMALQGVQLSALKSLSSSTSASTVPVHGRVDATADATWGKTASDLLAHANATLHGSMGPAAGDVRSTGAQSTLPIDGVVHAVYSAATGQATLNNSYLRTPRTSLDLNGTISKSSALQVQMRSTDLHELESAAGLLRPATASQPLGLYGAATFTGSVTGSTSDPRLRGRLSATDLRLKGSSWKLLRTDIDASPRSAALRNGQLVPATRGNIDFDLSATLRQWSFSDQSPFQVSLNASQLDAAELARLAGVQKPISGTLNARVNAHGTELQPQGDGDITLTQAKVVDEPIQTLDVRFNGTGDEIHSNLRLQMPAGVATAVLAYLPRTKGYDLKLKADNFHIEQLQSVKARNMQVSGAINLDASGRGTLNDPQLTASLQIPRLQVQDQSLSRVTLKADVAAHQARLALDSDVMSSHVRGGGTIALTGEYQSDLALDTNRIPFAPLVALYAPAQAGMLDGATELHATVRGPLKNKSLLEAHATIPMLNVNYKKAIEIAAAAPIHLDYTNGVLNLQRAELKGTGTDLTMQGRVPVIDRSAPVSLLLLGTVDLRLAQLVNPDITSAGQLKFNINSFGERSDPNVQGQVQIINASFTTPDAPLGMSEANGTLELTRDRLNISSFTATVGGGQVTARGGVLYRPSVQFDLALQGRGVRLLYPDNIRTGFGLNLTLTGSMDQALLAGTVNVNQLSFTPDFDLMEAMGSFSSDTTPPPSQGFTNDLSLQIAVRSTNGINLVNRQLSLQGAANLTVQGTAAQPVVLGRINLTGGDLIFKGNRYKLQGGTVEFVDPTRTEPSMNLAVTTTIQQYNIAMRFEGPVEHLRTSYTSDPALPPSDIISLIAFGKTDEASAANPNPPGALGAESLVASGVTSQVTNRVEKIAGISHLSIDPTLGNTQQNPGATVTIQQRVTSKIFVTFSSDVTDTQSQTIQLEYQRSPRVSYSATRDQNGGFAFDTKIKKSW